MNDQYYDALLNIKTVGDQKGFSQFLHYHRYEPTPFSALEQLFDQYELDSKDRIVDFGSGKGRLNFFIYYLFQATVMGVEMNETFYREAIENQKRFLKKYKNSKDKIHFQQCRAEEYQIHPQDNCFYFFNPFTVQIFMKIINNILLSAEQVEREIDLVLYYPSNDYIYFLENQTTFELYKEVVLSDLYPNNPYEKFLIYRMN